MTTVNSCRRPLTDRSASRPVPHRPVRRARPTRIAAALLAVAAAASSFLATAARAEVKSASPAGFVIENAEVVPVDAATAWTALVTEVARWWPKDHTWWGEASTLSIEARAGGCFCELAGQRQARHMTVAFVDPPKLLRMVGGLGPLQGMGLYGALDWSLEPVEGGTRIRLRYQAGGYASDDLSKFAPVVDRVQALQLGGLAEFLRKRAAAPEQSGAASGAKGSPSPGGGGEG
jgi:hypothetical protein